MIKTLLAFFKPTDPTNKHYGTWHFCILKIIICILLLFLISKRESIIHIPEAFSWMTDVLSVPVAIVLLFNIYVTIAELVGGKAKGSKPDENCKPVVIELEGILRLVKENDIIALVIRHDGAFIECGSSTDSTPTDLFDKRYYIGEKEFLSVEDFAAALSEHSINGKVDLLMVDGLDPEKTVHLYDLR